MTLKQGPEDLDGEGKAIFFLESAMRLTMITHQPGELYNYLKGLDEADRKEQMEKIQSVAEIFSFIHDRRGNIPRGDIRSAVDAVKNNMRMLLAL